MNPKIGCVIVNYNTSLLTMELAKSLITYDCVFKIVIVDNFSLQKEYERLCEIANPDIHVIRLNDNKGYGFGNNVGIRYLSETFDIKYALICNPDTWVAENSLSCCLEQLMNYHDAAVIAPIAKNAEGLPYSSSWNIPTKEEYIFSKLKLLGKFFPIRKDDYKGSGIREVGCISGAFLIFKVDEFFKVGLYDENLFLYCEETLLGIKFRNKNLKSLLSFDSYYVHNHVYKEENRRVVMLRLKRTLNSRMYLLRKYYKVNWLWLILAKISFFIVMKETAFFLTLNVFKRKFFCRR